MVVSDTWMSWLSTRQHASLWSNFGQHGFAKCILRYTFRGLIQLWAMCFMKSDRPVQSSAMCCIKSDMICTTWATYFTKSDKALGWHVYDDV